jgi:hypothetical protein
MLVSSGRPVFVLARDRRLASRLAFYRDHVTLTPSSTCPTQSVGVVTLGRVVHMAHFCSLRVAPPVPPLLLTLGACFIALCAAFALVIAPITSLCDGLRDLVSCTFRSPTSLCALPISPSLPPPFSSASAHRAVVLQRRDSSAMFTAHDCRLFDAGVHVRRLPLSQCRAARSVFLGRRLR